MHHKGSLFIISAPSGAGKTSLVHALIKEMDHLLVSVSYTTRSMREGERDGVNYNFVSQNDFKSMLNQGIFLEHASVFGNFYGTSRVWVEETLQKGVDVILEIDWQGARQIRTLFMDCVSIFILPPSKEDLKERLIKRHQDKPEIIDHRMEEATNEMAHFNEYDYLIINDRFEEALEDLKAIVRGTRLHLNRQQLKYASLIKKLL